jgi:hypothetical protein
MLAGRDITRAELNQRIPGSIAECWLRQKRSAGLLLEPEQALKRSAPGVLPDRDVTRRVAL